MFSVTSGYVHCNPRLPSSSPQDLDKDGVCMSQRGTTNHTGACSMLISV